MKTLLRLLIALIFVVPLRASTQRYYSPDFAIGVKGGATFSFLDWQPTVRQKTVSGFTAGVACRYTEERNFGLVAELNITQRGWAENYPAETGLSYRRTFTNLMLPVMTHIFFGKEKFKGFVNLGPEVGIMIDDKITANFDYADPAAVPGFPRNYRTDQLNMQPGSRFDYGIAGGLGCELRLRRKHSILIEGRFYYGLANVFPAGRRDVFGASRSLSAEVTASYLFRLK